MMSTSVAVSRLLSSLTGRVPASFQASIQQQSAFSTTQGAYNAQHQNSSSTLNEGEVDKFSKMMSDWWDPVKGSAVGLHSMNDLRVPLVRDGMVNTLRTDPKESKGPEPLAGTHILDVGCGGGILSEALARLGATVVGIDATGDAIETAKAHIQKEKNQILVGRLTYQNTTVEEYLASNGGEKFDAVVASEVIEHVENPPLFVQACSNLIVPGGSLFVTTINRTTRSYLGAILAAEYALRLLPVGTHDWNKFVTPEEVQGWMKAAGISKTRLVHGMFYIPFINKWTWVPDTSVNYAVHAIKVISDQKSTEGGETDGCDWRTGPPPS